MDKKQFRLTIEGIQREQGVFTPKEIKNKLRRKIIDDIINNTDEFCIEVFRTGYCDKYTQRSGWNIDYQQKHPIIKLKDAVGKEQIFDLNKLVHNNFIEEIDILLEQSKLLFLTGKHKDYECAWNDLINKIKYKGKEHKIGD